MDSDEVLFRKICRRTIYLHEDPIRQIYPESRLKTITKKCNFRYEV